MGASLQELFSALFINITLAMVGYGLSMAHKHSFVKRPVANVITES